MARQTSTDPAAKRKSRNSNGGKKNKPSMIGNDPLAWMKEQGDENSAEEMASASVETKGLDSEAAENIQKDHDKVIEKSAEISVSETLAPSKGADSLPDSESDQRSAPALVLESSLGVAVVSQLYEGMKPLLEQKSGIDIDASKVEAVDACGLQLLLGFVRSANEQSIPVRWKQVSPRLLEAAEFMDMKTHLGL